MSIESRIIAALSPIVPDIMPDEYTGSSLEYIEFNYDEVHLYANGTRAETRALIQVHYYLPKKSNALTKKGLIAQALKDAGCTYPSIINASDTLSQHYTFECEGIVESEGTV